MQPAECGKVQCVAGEPGGPGSGRRQRLQQQVGREYGRPRLRPGLLGVPRYHREQREDPAGQESSPLVETSRRPIAAIPPAASAARAEGSRAISSLPS
jgi:hypothetical protein